MRRLTDRHLRHRRRVEDPEINQEELWSEAGSRRVDRREQTGQSGCEVSVHAHEERDDVAQLLEAAGETADTHISKHQQRRWRLQLSKHSQR